MNPSQDNLVDDFIHLIGDGWLTEAYDLNDPDKLLDLIEWCETDVRKELLALIATITEEASSVASEKPQPRDEASGKQVDTFSAEFEELTNYLQGSFEQFLRANRESQTGASCKIAADYFMLRVLGMFRRQERRTDLKPSDSEATSEQAKSQSEPLPNQSLRNQIANYICTLPDGFISEDNDHIRVVNQILALIDNYTKQAIIANQIELADYIKQHIALGDLEEVLQEHLEALSAQTKDTE